MSNDAEIVHIALSATRAEAIRDALRLQGCEEHVIGLPGALNVGPIDPPDLDVRQT